MFIMADDTYKFVSFNCKNVKRSVHSIRELCKKSDIIALQETWLLPEDISYLNTISDEFGCTGVSAVDTSAGILRGRPHGGVALLWRRHLFRDVTIVQCGNSRICAVKIVIRDKSILVFSVYMPTDTVANLTDFTDTLSSVSAIIDNYNIDCVYVLGDFNAHPSEQFFDELSEFCSEQKWTCIDTKMLGIQSDTYTFLSEAHGSKRWLDHCLVTEAAKSSIVKVRVLYDVLWSDHFPLVVECKLSVIVSKSVINSWSNNMVVWGERSQDQIHLYQKECHKRLRLIDFPHDLSECCDMMCNNDEHKIVIDKFYSEVVHALSEAAVVGRRSSRGRLKRVVTGWNTHVADAHREAKQKFKLWVWYGKPVSGLVYNEMCEARKVFKARIKWCQDHEDQIKMDILASHHSRNDFRGFWKHTNKLQNRSEIPVSVGGVSEPKEIADHFKQHFFVKSPLGPSRTVLNIESGSEIGIKFKSKEVSQTIKFMSRGKSPGHDGLSIEHLRYAGPHLARVLTMLYSFCVSHSCLPSEMMRTVVVPIVKNRTGDLADRSNYRPISLATIISKVFDSLLNTQLNKTVNVHDNQFGFRRGLSTEAAVLCLKHTVTYYTQRGTPIYASFLDLSKAFDLVAYDVLWRKMEEDKLPTELINIFKYWYSNQINSVRWAGTFSRPYRLECGVRQGGLSSPTLFNLYVNGLIGELSGTRVGCYVDRICVNNISYADDMVLLSASICGLRKLVAKCEEYAKAHGLIYNSNKSEMMVFGAGGSPGYVPPVLLNGTPLQRVFKFKYLGHILTPDLNDELDIERERRALSVRANMLARRFARCSFKVKSTLFRAYCTTFYTCSLWARYTQRSYNALRVQYNNAFRVLVGLPRFCSASGMFADAHINCFYATMRIRCASLVRRVRASSNNILKMIASRLDCMYINHCSVISHGMK